MSVADDVSDFALESMFTRARKQMELGPALRHVLQELERARCARLLPVVVAVCEEVADRYNTTRDILLGPTVRKLLCRPRAIAWWLLKFRFDQFSYPQIGKPFGRHHTTILVALAAFQGLLQQDDRLRAELQDIEAAVAARLIRRAA